MVSKGNEIQKLVNKVSKKIVNIWACSTADCVLPQSTKSQQYPGKSAPSLLGEAKQGGGERGGGEEGR